MDICGQKAYPCCLRSRRIEVREGEPCLACHICYMRRSNSQTGGRAVVYRLQKQPSMLFICKIRSAFDSKWQDIAEL